MTDRPGATYELRTRTWPAVSPDIRRRVSTVVVQRVPAAAWTRFLACQRGLPRLPSVFRVTAERKSIRRRMSRQEEWVVVIHFDDQESLASLDQLFGARRVDQEAPSTKSGASSSRPCRPVSAPGLPGWSTGPEGEPPPSWKMALTVLLGLYPTVMLLALGVGGIPEPPGNGGVDADQQHAQRGDLPVGRDAATDHDALALAACKCTRQEASFVRRSWLDLAVSRGPRGPVSLVGRVNRWPMDFRGLQGFGSLFRNGCSFKRIN